MKCVCMIFLCMGVALYGIKSSTEGQERQQIEMSFKYKTPEQIFTDIYDHNLWRGWESLSGQGSGKSTTQAIRFVLPQICKKLVIKKMIDAPCGDFNWMQYVIDDLELQEYTGIDIVAAAIASNMQRYGTLTRTFIHADLICYVPERADLILSRDCLAHLSLKDAIQVIKNFKASGSTYLLTSHHLNTKQNRNIVNGDHYAINLQLAPFNFPAPMFIFKEADAERASAHQGKTLALWRLEDIDVSAMRDDIG